MHRDLSYHNSKLPAPIELQGRSLKKVGSQGTLGKWDNLIGTSQNDVMSPRCVTSRCRDYDNARRTIQPEFNTEEVKNKTRKITKKDQSEEPGNLLTLFRRTGTTQDVHKSKKKFFKEMQQTEEVMAPKIEKRFVKPHEKKKEDWCSQISTLISPTFIDKEQDNREELQSPRSPTSKLRLDFLKSAISVLPCGEDTKRAFQDKDEAKIMQSMNNPRVAKHLATTLQDEPLFVSPNKKDPNHQSDASYQDGNRLNHLTKGKKVSYPQYLERNVSSAVPTNRGDYGERTGGMEPLNPQFIGRRAIPPKPVANNVFQPPEEKNTPRGQTIFSYRTYASRVTF